MAIQTRRGLESELDINKAVSGEWLLSIDSRYVRICVQPGIVLRMATYESFEADMVQIETILSECKTIQSAIQRIQSEVNAKAALSIEYAQSAAESAEKAAESEAKAKMYAENAEAVTGVGIASQTKAGLVKGGENYIDESGELQLTKRTTSPTLYNSYPGGVKLNELGGVSEQGSTTGAQLLDISNAVGGENNGITVTVNSDESYDFVGTAESSSINVWLLGTYNSSKAVLTLEAGTYYIKGVNLYVVSQKNVGSIVDDGTGHFFTLTETTNYCGVRVMSATAGTTYNEKVYPILMKSDGITVPKWEPFTGNAPSPNPEYPQEIKPVTGKNLLDCRGVSETTALDITSTPIYDAYGNLEHLNINGTASSLYGLAVGESVNLRKGESIILSGCPSGGSTSTYRMQLREFVDGVAGSYIGNADTGSGATYTASADITVKAYVRIASGVVCNNLKFYPMIRPASIADDTYVPYGLLRFWGHGKNFLNLEEGSVDANGNEVSSTVARRTGYIHVYPNKNYTFQKAIAMSASNLNGMARTYDKNLNFIGSVLALGYQNITGATITFEENVKYIRFVQFGDVNTDWDNINLMMEEGDTATPYEPYTSQSIALSTPIELNGVGTAQDRFVRKDGVWKIERNMSEVVFDGSDDEGWIAETVSNESGIRFYKSLGNVVPSDTDTNGMHSLNTHLRLSIAGDTWDAVDVYTISGASKRLYVSLSGVTTLAEFKAWLAEKFMTVVCELAEPTYEELPTADQIALNSLVSYEGITYLNCDSEVQPTWDLEYGTSRVGGYTLEVWNKEENNRIKIEEAITAMLVMS